jgi:CO/xanthine dehydrogenase Mo-binding subunit
VLATHTAPNGAFRGFGAPQTLFAIERHMDRVARAAGLDPLTVRERNVYREGDVTPTGQRLTESVAALECLSRAEAATDFRTRHHAIAEERAKNPAARRRRGLGLSVFWHGSGFTGNGERRLMSKAAVRLRPDGRIEALASSTDFGQGTEGVFRQIVADAAGAPFEDVAVHAPDTGVVPDSGPTVASRTVMVVGELLRRAATELCEIVSNFRTSADPSFRDAARRCFASRGPSMCEARYEAPEGSAFEEKAYRGDAYAAYGWGSNVVEVEVDLDTFETRLVALTTVSDVGTVIHPVLCSGQVEGGTLQALGWGLMEEIKLKEGRYLNDRLQTYIIPTFADAPDMTTLLIGRTTPHGPFGAKGVGELPMDGGAPALLQAIENATGIALDAIPATPERLFAGRNESGRAGARPGAR